MKPSQVLYKITDALNLDLETILEIYRLESYQIDESYLKAILKRPSTKGYRSASYEDLGVFLDGLIKLTRGNSSNQISQDSEIELDNNLIIKKLRIALELKSIDMEVIFELAGRQISPSRLRNILRSSKHPKYQLSSDAILNDFLLGLAEYMADMPPIGR